MTFTPTEPTPCVMDNRWLTTDPADQQHAVNGCLTCPFLTACQNDRADKIRNDPDFGFFEGVMAGHVHDPRGDRRRRALANLNNRDGQAASNFAEANRRRREATHCKRGHEFNDDNTYVSPDGRRTCRVCVRVAKEKWARENGVPVNKATATHCQRGHEYTIENTRIEKDGRRRCRTCRTIKRRERENGGASDAA